MVFARLHKNGLVGIVLLFFAVAPFGVPTIAAKTVVFEDDFETCDFSKWNNVIDPSEGEITRSLTHSGTCAFRHGGENVKAGDLAYDIPSGGEFWMTGWHFFPNEYVLPAPGGGPHLWRIWNSTGAGFQLDFVIPDRLDSIKLNHFAGKSGGKTVQLQTAYNPIAGDRKARWQCWEVHAKLNRPGESDGIVEFYADGEFIAKITGNFRGVSTAGYTQALFSSNIGGDASLWPRQNWRYVDDVVLSTERVGCLPDVADKTPPRSPTGVRINSQ